MQPDDRLKRMSAVRSKGTKPEMAVRHLAWALGYRYRLHAKTLPGKPDLAFPGKRVALFVHGCFWHGHDCRRGRRVPPSNQGYWIPKIARNVERDAEARARLTALGWKVIVIWECETTDTEALRLKLNTSLD